MAVLRALKDRPSTTQVEIRPGVLVVALDDEPGDEYLKQHRLQVRTSDGWLRPFFKTVWPGPRVVVLTSDTGLSIKAPTR